MSKFTHHPERLLGKIIVLGLSATAALSLTHTVQADDSAIKKQLQGVDLKGVHHLTLSLDGKLAAGFTGLHSNPGTRSGSYSLFKIWSVKDKKLLHKFRLSGEAYALAFSADSSTIVTADRTGNLGYTTTVRAWDLPEATERKLGICGGVIHELCFSPENSRLATVAQLSSFDHKSAMAQINVWPVTGKGKPLNIDIPHPLGEWIELRPPVDARESNRPDQVCRRVVPTELLFSPDGKQLIGKSEAGFRTVYDAQTGNMLQHANISSIGLVKTAFIIAIHQVPKDVKLFTIDITPNKQNIRFQRAADGWWKMGQGEKYACKVDGKNFVTFINGVEKEEHITMLLGLEDDTKFSQLTSFRHPLGVIKIERNEKDLKLQLREVTEEMALGKTLQACEVRYVKKPNK
ncbi:MAG: WD40 repeat domain-containing protein [Akkermansiaceae bacterium]